MNNLLKSTKQELRRNKTLVFAVVFLAVVSTASILAFLSPYDPDAIDLLHRFQFPDLRHLAGTDDLGRDYLTRILFGGRISLLVGIMAMAISTSIGVAWGIVSGYAGGIIDNILMRLIDILSSIPWTILVTVISIYMKPGLNTIILVIGVFSWMSTARLVRAETLSIKEREWTLYAKAIHQKPLFIILRHILPSALPTIIVSASGGVANAIMMESALSFLGLGIQQPVSSWGSMLNRAQAVLGIAPYMSIIPGVLIVGTVFSFNAIGGAARVLSEPRTAAGEHE